MPKPPTTRATAATRKHNSHQSSRANGSYEGKLRDVVDVLCENLFMDLSNDMGESDMISVLNMSTEFDTQIQPTLCERKSCEGSQEIVRGLIGLARQTKN